MRAAIIGAGLAGLTVARRLVAEGVDVQLFEKARGASGRLSTRRTDHGAFDHGAQYFTARDPRFVQEVGRWVEDGIVAEWSPRLVQIRVGGENEVDSDIGAEVGGARGEHSISYSPIRYVGKPSMSALGRYLVSAAASQEGESLKLEVGVRIERVRRASVASGSPRSRWTLVSDAGFEYPNFDLLVIAVPSPQAIPFLTTQALWAAQAREVQMLPCHAVLVRFEKDLDVNFDGAFVAESPLSWVARNHSKPGREGDPCWLLHSTAAWSEAHIEDDSDAIVGELLSAFEELLGTSLPVVEYASSHRWLYARPQDVLDGSVLWDADQAIGVCGDWTRGDRVEDAYLSGLDLAQAISDSIDLA